MNLTGMSLYEFKGVHLNFKGMSLYECKRDPYDSCEIQSGHSSGSRNSASYSRLGWLLDHPFAGLIKTICLYGFFRGILGFGFVVIPGFWGLGKEACL